MMVSLFQIVVSNSCVRAFASARVTELHQVSEWSSLIYFFLGRLEVSTVLYNFFGGVSDSIVALDWVSIWSSSSLLNWVCRISSLGVDCCGSEFQGLSWLRSGNGSGVL